MQAGRAQLGRLRGSVRREAEGSPSVSAKRTTIRPSIQYGMGGRCLGAICAAVGLVWSQTSPNTSKAWCGRGRRSSRIDPAPFIHSLIDAAGTDGRTHDCTAQRSAAPSGHGAPNGWLAGCLPVPVGQVSQRSSRSG